MRTLTFIVPPEYDGVKAHGFLRGYCGLSHRLLCAQKHVEDGVTADGKLLRTIDRVSAGSTVRILIPDDCTPAEVNCLSIEPVYEDADVLVFDKPPYMPVHPARGHERDALSGACAAYLAGSGQRETFRPIGRLDRNTSGLQPTARNPYAAARLTGRAAKTYLAVCEGTLWGAGVIRAPLHVKPGHTIQREGGGYGERAVTRWTALCRGGGHTLLRLTLDTGRTHQIRAHMSYLGYPLAGDDMYGGGHAWIGRQALHCAALRFEHPVTRKPIDLSSPLPEDMQALCDALSLTF